MSLTNTCPNKTNGFPKFPWTRITTPDIKFPFNKQSHSMLECLEEASLLEAEQAFKKKYVAAIILEPILGEGGDCHLRVNYLQKLRDLAHKNDALFIFDEVQTGVGLTGKMWAYEHFGITPDLLVFGKKVQSCGVCATTRIDCVRDNVFTCPNRISSTWGGNLVDMVRSTIQIKIIKEENLIENARVMGDYFLDQLQQLTQKYKIKNVRGRGLMIAFDCQDNARRDKILNKMRESMLILPCGEKSIRFRPHLNVNKEEVDRAIEITHDAIQFNEKI